MFKLSVISPNATYQLNTTVDPVDEGQSSTITLTTTGVQEGQTIPYTIGGVGITSDDISGEPLTGNFVVSGGVASKTLNIASDVTTEGQETLTMSLGNGTNVSLAINDTSLTPAAGDAHYDSVTLLMHMDGANNGTTFTDEKGGIVSVFGSASTVTSTKKFGTSSAYFNGTGRLSLPYATSLYDWYSSDYTLECWIYINDMGSVSYNDGGQQNPVLIGNQNPTGVGNYWSFGPTNAGALRLVWWNGSSQTFFTSASSILATNSWYHIALTKAGSTLRMFKNGVEVANTTLTNTPQSSSSLPLSIGQGNNAAMNGYIDDLRITKGVARYTSNFTIPEAAFPNVKNENIDPFWNNVVLGMHMDGMDNGTTFAELTGKTVTRYGNAVTKTSVKKFGTASAYFDGSSDYIRVTSSPDFNFGTSDFSIELWANFVNPSSASDQFFVGSDFSNWSANAWIFGKHNVYGGKVSFWVYNINSSAALLIAPTLPQAGWHHYAVTRRGSIFNLYVDGVNVSTTTSSASLNSVTSGLVIGAASDNTSVGINGYIDDVRITKGVGRYVTNFTPPTRSFAEMA